MLRITVTLGCVSVRTLALSARARVRARCAYQELARLQNPGGRRLRRAALRRVEPATHPPMSRLALAAACVMLVLAGCAVSDPYENHSARPTPAPRAPGNGGPPGESHEAGPAPVPAPVALPRRGGARSARSAAAAFARAWTNWSWRTIRTSGRARAALAAGELRRRVLQDTRAARTDRTLARDRIVNHGEVLAVDARVRGGVGTAYAVVRETNAADGIAVIGDTVMRVYRAELRRSSLGGWFVTAWEDAS
jgi:hypothetical protein